jgi:sugar (pentulose or hexulose) kinase
VSRPGRIAVVDVGKTNTKLGVVDDAGVVLEERKAPSRVLAGSPYPHLDVDGALAWILDGLRELAQRWPIEVVVPVAHGAAAALLAGDELALPVMDYEFAGPDELASTYPAPPFEETLSPHLSAGLNLGRQLHWQSARMPDAFARVTDILLYPQYIGWRLTGRRVSEVTSLGCHTDLWCPRSRTFSSLASSRRWDALFPPIEPAWAELGVLEPDVRTATGLSPSCRVLVGIHDSNASYLPHRTARRPPFSVVSTGTWIVCMAAGGSIDRLDPAAGTLANVDVFGDPLPTSRFMGGRDLEAIAQAGGGRIEADMADLRRVVDRPEGTGGELPRERAARGVLHCALRTDLSLDRIGANGPCIVEGSFVRTPAFAALLAALRSEEVLVAREASGTAVGAAILAKGPAASAAGSPEACRAAEVGDLDRYRARWRSEVEGHPNARAQSHGTEQA